MDQRQLQNPQSSTDKDRLLFFDTTLRDGEQSPGCSMSLDEKLLMARCLEELGVDIIEAGFPIASEGVFRSVQAIAAQAQRSRIASLARARRDDIERAAAAIEHANLGRIHVFLASSDLHLEYKLKISRSQALAQVGEFVALARTYCEDVEFSPEDATRTDPAFLCEMVAVAVEAGATTINMPDTVGYSTPEEYGAMFRTVREHIVRERITGAGGVIFSSHCHDDLGLAVANSLAAIENGALQVECALNGIGERAGNAALEELAAIIRVRRDRYPVDHGIDTTKLNPASRLLTSIIAFGPAPNKSIVGANAFAHEAGIHQHGVLANPLCYEIMTPVSMGVPSNRMVLGKHSGRHALRSRLEEMGYDLGPADLDAAYRAFTQLADVKKALYDQDLINLVAHHKRHRDLSPGDSGLKVVSTHIGAAEPEKKVAEHDPVAERVAEAG